MKIPWITYNVTYIVAHNIVAKTNEHDNFWTHWFNPSYSQVKGLRGNVVEQLLVNVFNPGYVNNLCVAQINVQYIYFIRIPTLKKTFLKLVKEW